MRSCLRKLWRPELGGFLDRLPIDERRRRHRSLADPLVPFAVNCQAARVLARLARETGDDRLRDTAAETLAALAPALHDQGIAAADYALAVAEVTARVQA